MKTEMHKLGIYNGEDDVLGWVGRGGVYIPNALAHRKPHLLIHFLSIESADKARRALKELKHGLSVSCRIVTVNIAMVDTPIRKDRYLSEPVRPGYAIARVTHSKEVKGYLLNKLEWVKPRKKTGRVTRVRVFKDKRAADKFINTRLNPNRSIAVPSPV